MTTRASTPIIEARGLVKRFGTVEALAGLDLVAEPGKVVAVLGPNGAGKTTFVSLVSGRLQPSSGTVAFDGQDITGLPAHLRVRLGIAYTFQITSVFANLTAYDNVALAVQRTLDDDNHRRGARAFHDAVLAALERTGLAGRAGQLAATLSYGHQRLLEVAMGLALKPRLLILDEPTQGLSDSEIENFIALVREIAGQTTVLLIEHNMDCVMRLADRITVFEAGHILAEGAPEAIRADPDVQRAYLGTAGDG
jgi:branched-chain amino acid transport system ATP-binding protein